ncbi:uncharacterized protein LOC143554055 [Bidens hawaiensis]|uniref:uncharacterized protein LOC143554055 n=1 Tax=Bidens hawaiensis TaxID=980011 RepID=UPI00404907E1
MDQDLCGFNRNKRKFEDGILEVRVAKHTCLDIIKNSMSAKDSNSFSEDADSVMSMSDDFMLHNDAAHSTSSSVNWSDISSERLEAKACDDVSASNLFALLSSEDCEISSLEYECKQSMEDFLCSNGIVSNNSVLSSGRWNVNQDAEQGAEKLTIDKEFEQYFSMLML